MLKSIQNTAELRTSAQQRSRSVVAFDGDDTLWIDDRDEKRWERHCKRLSVAGLPHPAIAEPFRRRLRELGYTPQAVQRALLESAREICDKDIPADWRAQVEAIPRCANWLSLRCPPELDAAIRSLQRQGHTLWIITKGDLIRQAIKLSCFPFLHEFRLVEIVHRKDATTYARLLAANGVAPAELTMVGDTFRDDVIPVVRLGGRAIHVPIGGWAALRPLARLLPTDRVRVCRNLAEVPEAIVGEQHA
jgi:putative hydrolase of the HAD superfamily